MLDTGKTPPVEQKLVWYLLHKTNFDGAVTNINITSKTIQQRVYIISSTMPNTV